MYGKIKSKLPNVSKWVSIEVHCTSHLTVFYFIIRRIIVCNMMLPLLCVYTYTGDSHHWKCKCFSYRWVKICFISTGRYMSLLLYMNISVLLVIMHFLILSI